MDYTNKIIQILDYLEYCRGIGVIDEHLYDLRRSYLINMSLGSYSKEMKTNEEVKRRSMAMLNNIIHGWEEQDLDKIDAKG